MDGISPRNEPAMARGEAVGSIDKPLGFHKDAEIEIGVRSREFAESGGADDL